MILLSSRSFFLSSNRGVVVFAEDQRLRRVTCPCKAFEFFVTHSRTQMPRRSSFRRSVRPLSMTFFSASCSAFASLFQSLIPLENQA